MAATFKDTKNRQWEIRLNGPVIKDIQETFGVKLTALDSDPLNQLATDPVMLVDVLYLLCAEQCKAQNISSREFGESLDPGLDGPIAALKEAIINFFPSGKRSAILSTLEANEKVVTKASEILLKKLSSEHLIQRIADKMAKEGDRQIELELNQEATAPPSTSG